jgi:hypothetical protein
LVYTDEKEFYKMDMTKKVDRRSTGLEFLGTWNWTNQYPLADMDGMAFSKGVHNIPFYF